MHNARLSDFTEAGSLDDLMGHSITCRIAVGPRAGQKLFTLQTVPARLHGLEGNINGAATSAGFSLHAGIDLQPGQHAKLERLYRYVSRPPVATERLAMTSSGQVRYQLKTPYRDGTTHIVVARGHRRRRPACFDSEGEGHSRWPVTRLGRAGACRHCAWRQARSRHETRSAK
jgi:hypothetical protein